MAIIQLKKSEYARLVAAEAQLRVLLQCRYKPVEQLQAVLHCVAGAVETQNKEESNA